MPTKIGKGLHSSAPTTILVVDDDALINMGTVDIVTELGHKAVEAYSGQQALDLLHADASIMMMITDYAMPGMNGVELAQRARMLRPELGIVLATGYGELPDGQQSDLPRLSKPFREEELAACLTDLLRSLGAT